MIPAGGLEVPGACGVTLKEVWAGRTRSRLSLDRPVEREHDTHVAAVDLTMRGAQSTPDRMGGPEPSWGANAATAA
jgi:hypothetical protein